MNARAQSPDKEFFLTELSVQETDITSVHNAFSNAEPSLLLDAVLLIDPSWSSSPLGITGQSRDILLNRIQATLDVMYALEPIIEPDRNQLIIPWQDFCISEDGSAISRGLGSCVLNCDQLEDARTTARRFGGAIWSVPRLLRFLDEGRHPLETLEASGLLAPIQALSAKAWPEALGYMVWLPSNLCCLERYSVLASIFWAMTASGFGFTRGRTDKPVMHYDSFKHDFSFFAEYVEKMELLADVMNYNTWLEAIQAGEALCQEDSSVSKKL